MTSGYNPYVEDFFVDLPLVNGVPVFTYANDIEYPPAPSDVYAGIPGSNLLPSGKVYNWPALMHSPIILTWSGNMFGPTFMNKYFLNYDGDPSESQPHQAAAIVAQWIQSGSRMATTPLYYDPFDKITSGIIYDPNNASVGGRYWSLPAIKANGDSWWDFNGTSQPAPPVVFMLQDCATALAPGRMLNPWLMLSLPQNVAWINDNWANYVKWLTGMTVVKGSTPYKNPLPNLMNQLPSLWWLALPAATFAAKKLLTLPFK